MARETRARHRRGVESPLLAPWRQNPGRRPEPSRRAAARETQEPRRTEFDLRGQLYVVRRSPPVARQRAYTRARIRIEPQISPRFGLSLLSEALPFGA